MLSINCIRCAFGPGSIASRGLLFGAETVSRIRRSEWDALSGWSFKRKVHPGIRAWNGTHFPEQPSTGNCDPESMLRMGCAFRIAFRRKLHPIPSLHSGTRFPQGGDCGRFLGPLRGPSFVGKPCPILSIQSGTWFPRVLPTGKRVPVWQADGHKLSSSYRSTSLSHVGSAVCRIPAVCSFLASIPAERTSFMVKRSRG